MPYAQVGRALALAAGLALAAAAGGQQMYKWVDEKGVTHFSENPPPEGAKAQKFEPKVTPRSSSGAPASESPEKWKGQEADFRKRQIERSKAEDADARQASVRASRCADAKRRLEWYESGRIYRDNPDGTRVWMEESQREAQLREQRDIIRTNCN